MHSSYSFGTNFLLKTLLALGVGLTIAALL
jgi:hypothetical protein